MHGRYKQADKHTCMPCVMRVFDSYSLILDDDDDDDDDDDGNVAA